MEKQLRLVRTVDQIKDDVICELRNGWKSKADLVRRHGLSSDIVAELQQAVDPEQKNRKIKILRDRPPKAQPPVVVSVPAAPLSVRFVHRTQDLAIAAIALILAGVGLALNWQFIGSLGQTVLSGYLLGVVGIAIDMTAVFLPARVALLWEQKSRAKSAIAGVVWVICFAISVVSGLSFAATNIGDSLQGRESVVRHRQALLSELATAQQERAVIVESRDPQAIEDLIQLERGRIGSVILSRSKECTDITLLGSTNACTPLKDLRGAKRQAERRIELDSRMRQISGEISSLPSIGLKSPGAQSLSGLLGGLVSAESIETHWVVGIAIMPSLAGLLLLFARKR